MTYVLLILFPLGLLIGYLIGRRPVHAEIAKKTLEQMLHEREHEAQGKREGIDRRYDHAQRVARISQLVEQELKRKKRRTPWDLQAQVAKILK
jgi:hypothetical protein